MGSSFIGDACDYSTRARIELLLLKTLWIVRFSGIVPDLKMKMRTGRDPCGSDASNQLIDVDPLAHAYIDLGQVTVTRCENTSSLGSLDGVAYLDQVAIASGPSGGHDDPITREDDGVAIGLRDV
jgi:hypothetical protein